MALICSTSRGRLRTVSVVGASLLTLLTASATAGNTSRASVGSAGTESNAASESPSISANGRYVAFQSQASNLVANDTNNKDDIFVHDRVERKTTRISVSSRGVQGNGWSIRPKISPDGRYVVFESNASNLVPGDGNLNWDIFIHDRQTGTTRRISTARHGGDSDGASLSAAISLDGRVVVFASDATDLVPGDTNGKWDIFAHDIASGITSRVSVATGGVQANGGSFLPGLSNEGRFVTFVSGATNLVPGDSNRKRDVFVHDRLTRITMRVSVDSSGKQGNDDSGSTVLHGPSISADGRFVAFASLASNLVTRDTNSTWDVFVHDLFSRKTRRVSVTSYGFQSNDWSLYPSLSADGQFVAFQSAASNLVDGDQNMTADVFLHDLRLNVTLRFSVDSRGQEGNGPSARRGTTIAPYGSVVAFESQAGNLTFDDLNGMPDIFVHEFFPLLAADSLRVGRQAEIYLYAPDTPHHPYLLGAARTSSPGYLVDYRRIPLNFDGLTEIALTTPAIFKDFAGVTDANGFARACINVPNQPALIGQRFYLAFITISPSARSGIAGISNALPVAVVQ